MHYDLYKINKLKNKSMQLAGEEYSYILVRVDEGKSIF
jgi:hypothetical protein